MWKCKTCDKVNDDKLEICWGCYTPKRNNYIELGDTDVTASFGDLQKEETKRKAPEQFIKLLLINIPILLFLLTCLGLLVYFNSYIEDELPFIVIFLSVSILFFSYFILLYNREKVSLTLGYIFHTIILLISIWFIVEALKETYILIGLYCFIFSIKSIFILNKMKKNFIK
ncbi:TPA: hypothetical protein DCR49_02190 [Candidatus Delongbacteria bacterium]|nr:hypothetical protein [Candidatus Delongbacteria bacterium]